MISLTKKIGVLTLCTFLLACNKGKFKTNDSDFQNIYNKLIKDGNEAKFTWDTEVHSYTFTLNENKNLKSIGYQSHEDLSTTDYVFEIINNSDSSIVYSGAHKFSSKDISYVTPTIPVNLVSGVSYTIRRIQTNWQQDIARTIGHIVKTDPSVYPLQYGVLKITETQFHDSQSTNSGQINQALPRIDIVLE